MSKKPIFTNIVQEDAMREIQSRTLQMIRDSLKKSFGPYGSNTIITKAAGGDNLLVNYTKDGHTILKSLMFQDVIESSVKNNIEDITRSIVLKVGDGTTSAVLLSSIIFNKLVEMTSDRTPYQIISDFKEAVKNISEEILKSKKEFNSDIAYNIAMVSTNGNIEVSNHIKDIYEKYGSDVYIDVSTSTTEDTMIKIYDGLTLETGYADTCFINTTTGVSHIRNPQIFVFDDPIDTLEMGGFLDAIIANNILTPFSQGQMDKVKPTVIFAPKISRDYSAYMERLSTILYQFANPMEKPPLLIVTNIHESDKYSDLAQLCGCKPIKKYIDKKHYDEDVSRGLAPTKDTIFDFYGSADLIESNALKTKVINPKLMYKEGTTEYSDTFNNLVSFLEAELLRTREETTDSTARLKIRKRLQSLKSNLVEYLVGGVSISDRDSLKDLVEDAILNCRSASKSGVGYASNFEGLRASKKCMDEIKDNPMYRIIHNAYSDILTELYRVSGIAEIKISKIINTSLKENKPYDIVSGDYSDNIVSSIDTDIYILDGISKIMTLMVTSNQFLCPDFMYNKYTNKTE